MTNRADARIDPPQRDFGLEVRRGMDLDYDRYPVGAVLICRPTSALGREPQPSERVVIRRPLGDGEAVHVAVFREAPRHTCPGDILGVVLGSYREE
jgi:hypothetical protein